ncbi:hypothetical protein F8388_020569 [Cannabis sativa]|uniref:EXS domain-containing protein n=1 Tax=Cannabis sativa TaxID=3483 RepID=A0A7J6EPF3_CANSA|nr:hypothetical protein F8388_020569 [Cannabis sativa]
MKHTDVEEEELDRQWEMLPLHFVCACGCARRWFDECDPTHLANMGEYVSSIVVARAIVLVTHVVATIYQLYWDFVKDLGLLNSKLRNAWLRDDLILKN